MHKRHIEIEQILIFVCCVPKPINVSSGGWVGGFDSRWNILLLRSNIDLLRWPLNLSYSYLPGLSLTISHSDSHSLSQTLESRLWLLPFVTLNLTLILFLLTHSKSDPQSISLPLPLPPTSTHLLTIMNLTKLDSHL